MTVDPSRLDLNLLRVFDALSGEHKVVAAAARLKLSPPAVSNALARLRRATGDQLFTRVPGGMQPTAYAQAIAPAIHDALAAIDNAMTARAPFAAERSARAFRVAMTDIGEIHFLPRLLQAVRACRTVGGAVDRARFRNRPARRNRPRHVRPGGRLAARPERRLSPAAPVHPALRVPDGAEQPAGARHIDKIALPGGGHVAGAGRRHRTPAPSTSRRAAPGRRANWC